MTAEIAYQPVLDFWFGELVDGLPVEPRGQLWFGGLPESDNNIRNHFAALVEDALNNKLAKWQKSPKGTLALIIVLDQFTRSIYRKTAQAFAGDSQAQALSKTCITKGWDQKLAFSERQFIYMPLMHSEDLETQELCVTVFADLAQKGDSKQREIAENSLTYAIEHKELIARFGRFPYRNSVLGRINTAEENEYMKANPNSYGQ